MAILEQTLTNTSALYHGDCIEVMRSLPEHCVDFSIYSPPFAGLYQYSSDIRDLSNCLSKEDFFAHYDFVVAEVLRLTKPGRMTAVHCTDIPTGNTGHDALYDFPGDIIRQHERMGWRFVARHHIWKEPLLVRNRTMSKGLAHKQVVDDSTRTSIANADQLLIFRAPGQNAVPVHHTFGLADYAGDTPVPHEFHQYRYWDGDQKENRYSQWIWRRYADAWWLDIRIDNVLPFRDARDEDDEKHVHPLQLDVIERGIVLYSNPGETVLTPFMGVGSEAYQAVRCQRKAIGIELKASYYRQAIANMSYALPGESGEPQRMMGFALEA